MSSIPLVALQGAPRPEPNAPPDALSMFQKAAQLQTSAAQQGLIQQQTQGLQQQNEAQGLQLKDEELRRSLAPKFVTKDESGKPTGFDNEGLYNAMLQGGADPASIQAARMKQAQMEEALTNLSDKKMEHVQKVHSAVQDALEQVQQVNDKESKENAPTAPGTAPAGAVAPQSAPQQPSPTGIPGLQGGAPLVNGQIPEPAPQTPTAPQQGPTPRPIGPKTQAAYQQQLMNLAQQGVDISKFQPVLHDASDIEQAEAQQGSLTQALKNAKDRATTQESSNKGEAELWKSAGPDTLLNIHTGQMIHGVGSPQQEAFREYVRNGGNPLNFASDQAAREASNPALQAAKLHDAVALKSIEQSISDGDPAAAAKLLTDGTVAPNQLISSRKPEFAQKAFTLAAQMQPGWNAQKADADYSVAKSPENVKFFGSAKSLTDPGGTLDQLKAAAKDIPEGKIPIFNSFADAAKAATGDGPIAKYAAILTGVADDYSKVMGGGSGSDASRNQGISLVPAKASLDQKTQAIDGIRSAVTSQALSRIGNNQVLKRMYGDNLPNKQQTQSGGSISVTDPRGHIHTFTDQASADNFKRLANIQ